MIGPLVFAILTVVATTIFGVGVLELYDLWAMRTVYTFIVLAGAAMMGLDFIFGILSSIGEGIEGAFEGFFDAFNFDLNFDSDLSGTEHFSFNGMFMWTLSVYMMAYGGTGLYLTGKDISPRIIVFIASLLPMIVASLAFKFVFSKLDVPTSAVEDSDIVGKEAIVIVPIKPGKKGQVFISIPGAGKLTFSAVSEGTHKVGSRVIIDSKIGSTLSVFDVKD
jgi:hypothetical protein